METHFLEALGVCINHDYPDSLKIIFHNTIASHVCVQYYFSTKLDLNVSPVLVNKLSKKC